MSTAVDVVASGVSIPVPDGWKVVSKALDGVKCIGTHNGSFHCDEALACAMLKMLPEWEEAVVVRTRDPAELEKCAVVVDVGGAYDPSTLRFDHHQKTFQGTLDGYATRLSSAGLVYKHFGHQVLRRIVKGEAATVPDRVVDGVLYPKVYKKFVEHIDGIDNGVEVADGDLKYDISTHLSSRVGKLNPSWNEETPAEGPGSSNERFLRAMSLTGGELAGYVRGLARSWWPARSLVEEALAAREAAHPSGQVVVLETYCPWQSHLLDVEAEQGLAGLAKYVVYQDSWGKWRIQAVPEAEGSFTSRLPLPAVWQGLRDAELDSAAGIEGCIFVHATGFIGGNATKAGALAMASKALAMAAAAGSDAAGA